MDAALRGTESGLQPPSIAFLQNPGFRLPGFAELGYCCLMPEMRSPLSPNGMTRVVDSFSRGCASKFPGASGGKGALICFWAPNELANCGDRFLTRIKGSVTIIMVK